MKYKLTQHLFKNTLTRLISMISMMLFIDHASYGDEFTETHAHAIPYFQQTVTKYNLIDHTEDTETENGEITITYNVESPTDEDTIYDVTIETSVSNPLISAYTLGLQGRLHPVIITNVVDGVFELYVKGKDEAIWKSKKGPTSKIIRHGRDSQSRLQKEDIWFIKIVESPCVFQVLSGRNNLDFDLDNYNKSSHGSNPPGARPGGPN